MAEPMRKRVKYQDAVPAVQALPVNGLVILTSDQVAQIVEEAVARGMSAARAVPVGGLVSKSEACRALRVSAYKLDELVKAGLPIVRLGAQSPRFDIEDCVRWLKAREGAESTPDPKGTPHG